MLLNSRRFTAHSFHIHSLVNVNTMSRRSSRIIATGTSTAPAPIQLNALKIEEDLYNKQAPATPKKRKAPTHAQKIASPRKKSPKKSAPKVILYSSDLAKIAPENKWMDLQVHPEELRPSATLTTGQCFNWMVVRVQHDDDDCKNIDGKNSSSSSQLSQAQSSSAWGTHDETEWIGPVQDMVLSIRETPTTTLYRVLHGPTGTEDISDFLADYFQLATPLVPLYNSWSANDERLAKIASVIPGVRIIRQNPIECLFSFICSSNNNIPRITKMLSSFRETYGVKMLDLPVRLLENEQVSEQPLDDPMALYSFPTLDQLKPSTEEDLRAMGLGYRAKFIIQTRDLLIKSGGQDFLLSLRKKDADTVQEELLKFMGIGRKVADCVGLFSLDQCEAIPADVHVQHIASRDYDPTVLGEAKSLTPTVYKRVGDLFRDRFEYAGWAHSLLFVAELPSFRNVLPEDVVAEMDAVSTDDSVYYSLMMCML